MGSRKVRFLYAVYSGLLVLWLTGWDIILLLLGHDVAEQMQGKALLFAGLAAVGVFGQWVSVRCGKRPLTSLVLSLVWVVFPLVFLAALPVTWAFLLPTAGKPPSYLVITRSLAVLSAIARIMIWMVWWRLAILGTGHRADVQAVASVEDQSP